MSYVEKCSVENIKVERYFGDNDSLLFEDIIIEIVKNIVDSYGNQSYHTKEVNDATSSKEEVA